MTKPLMKLTLVFAFMGAMYTANAESPAPVNANEKHNSGQSSLKPCATEVIKDSNAKQCVNMYAGLARTGSMNKETINAGIIQNCKCLP